MTSPRSPAVDWLVSLDAAGRARVVRALARMIVEEERDASRWRDVRDPPNPDGKTK